MLWMHRSIFLRGSVPDPRPVRSELTSLRFVDFGLRPSPAAPARPSGKFGWGPTPKATRGPLAGAPSGALGRGRVTTPRDSVVRVPEGRNEIHHRAEADPSCWPRAAMSRRACR